MYQKGLKDEELFCKITGAVKGSRADDFNHIDVRLDGKTYDVKGYRGCIKNGFVLVEFANVAGNNGWCSLDSCDKVAFRDKDNFIVVDNKKLRLFTEKMVEIHGNGKVMRENGLHKKHGYDKIKYQAIGRRGRKDVFVYIKKDDIMALAERVYVAK
jgi:hypothetical protein